MSNDKNPKDLQADARQDEGGKPGRARPAVLPTDRRQGRRQGRRDHERPSQRQCPGGTVRHPIRVRWQDGRGTAGRDDLASRQAPRNPHSSFVPQGCARLPPGRQLPRLHGRDRRRKGARRLVQAHARGRHEGEEPERPSGEGPRDGHGTVGRRSASPGHVPRSHVAFLDSRQIMSG